MGGAFFSLIQKCDYYLIFIGRKAMRKKNKLSVIHKNKKGIKEFAP